MNARRGFWVLLLLCSAVCRRSSEPAEAVPADLRLHGARILLEQDGFLVHVFDDDHPPYLSTAEAFVPQSVRVNDAELAVTSTSSRAGRFHIRLEPFLNDGHLRVQDRSWRVRRVAPKGAWPELAAERALVDSDPAAALEEIEFRLEALDGLLLLEAHQMRVSLTRRLDAGLATAAIEAWSAAARRVGAPTEHARALRLLAYYAFRERRFPEAQTLLNRAANVSVAIGDEEGIALVAFYRGLVLAELGQYRRALDVTQHALEIADAAGLDDAMRYVATARVASLVELGRYEDALALLERVAPSVATAAPTMQASYAADRGFVLARGMATGAFERDWPGVLRALERARALLIEAGKPDLANISATNLLYARYQAGEFEKARALLDELESEGALPADVDVLTRLMRGHLALHAGQLERAGRSYEAALELALAESDGRASDLTWRAHYGRARAATVERATQHYLLAMDHLEAVTRRTEIARDRATFIDDRGQLFADAVEAFIAARRNDLAVLAADRSRSQTYRVLYGRAMLDALDDGTHLAWRKALDRYDEARAALERRKREAELVPHDALADFHRETERRRRALDRRFDAAFAYVEGAHRSVEIESIDRIQAALGEHDALLVPWTDGDTDVWFGVRRNEVRRFAARPSTPWWPAQDGVMFVATMGAEDPWRVLGGDAEARAWLDAVAVAFVSFPSLLVLESNAGNGRPIVVADTASDLPMARGEAEQVAKRMDDPVVLLGEQATRANVLAALEDAEHFHFAGHGVLDAADPWDAHFVLAGQERLTVGDLFASRPMARHVVLSGCETGRTGRTVKIGLPDAFIASGARTVVATTRPVSDNQAAAFIQRFYDAGGATDPVHAYRRAARAADDDTWSAYFVLGGRR